MDYLLIFGCALNITYGVIGIIRKRIFLGRAITIYKGSSAIIIGSMFVLLGLFFAVNLKLFSNQGNISMKIVSAFVGIICALLLNKFLDNPTTYYKEEPINKRYITLIISLGISLLLFSLLLIHIQRI